MFQQSFMGKILKYIFLVTSREDIFWNILAVWVFSLSLPSIFFTLACFLFARWKILQTSPHTYFNVRPWTLVMSFFSTHDVGVQFDEAPLSRENVNGYFIWLLRSLKLFIGWCKDWKKNKKNKIKFMCGACHQI